MPELTETEKQALVKSVNELNVDLESGLDVSFEQIQESSTAERILEEIDKIREALQVLAPPKRLFESLNQRNLDMIVKSRAVVIINEILKTKTINPENLSIKKAEIDVGKIKSPEETSITAPPKSQQTEESDIGDIIDMSDMESQVKDTTEPVEEVIKKPKEPVKTASIKFFLTDNDSEPEQELRKSVKPITAKKIGPSADEIWKKYYSPFQEYTQTLKDPALQNLARGLLLELIEAKRKGTLTDEAFIKKMAAAAASFEEAPKIDAAIPIFNRFKSEFEDLVGRVENQELANEIRGLQLELHDAKFKGTLTDPEVIKKFEEAVIRAQKAPKKPITEITAKSKTESDTDPGTGLTTEEQQTKTEGANEVIKTQSTSTSTTPPTSKIEAEDFVKLPVVVTEVHKFSIFPFEYILRNESSESAEEKLAIHSLGKALNSFKQEYLEYINVSNEINGGTIAPSIFQMEEIQDYFVRTLPSAINKLRVNFESSLPKTSRFLQKDVFSRYRKPEKAVKSELSKMLDQIEKGQKIIQKRITKKKADIAAAYQKKQLTESQKLQQLGLDQFALDQSQSQPPDTRPFKEQYGPQLRRYQSIIDQLLGLLKSELGIVPIDVIPEVLTQKVAKDSGELTKQEEEKKNLYRDFQREFPNVPSYIKEEYEEWEEKELTKRKYEAKLNRFKGALKYNLRLTKKDYRDFISKVNQGTLKKSMSQFTDEEKGNLIVERTHDMFIEYQFSDKKDTSIEKDRTKLSVEDSWKKQTEDIFRQIYGNWQISKMYIDPSKFPDIPLENKDKQVKKRLPLIRSNIFLMKKQLQAYRLQNPTKEEVPPEIAKLGIMAKELSDWDISDQQRKYFSEIIKPEERSFADKMKDKFSIKPKPKQEVRTLSQSQQTEEAVQQKEPGKKGIFKRRFKIK